MACGNVANMILARSMARRREMAVRLSLGADPGRIVRQLLTESFILAVPGAAGGMLFAYWFSSLARSIQPMMPAYVHFETTFQWQSPGIAVLVAGGCAVIFGVAPALRASRIDVHAGLRTGGASNGISRRWFTMRNLLVFQQVTISMVLLLLTGFIVIGWNRSAGVNLGLIPKTCTGRVSTRCATAIRRSRRRPSSANSRRNCAACPASLRLAWRRRCRSQSRAGRR